MGFLGDIAGGLFSKLGDAVIGDFFGDSNAKDQFERNQQLMQQQMAINKEMYQNRYTWTVDDMRRAGLNPILAASGGFSVGSGPQVSLPSQAMASMPSVPSISTSAKDLTENLFLESQTEKTKAERLKIVEDTIKIQNEAALVIEQAEKTRREQNLVSAQESKTLEEVFKTMKEVGFLTTSIMKNYVEMDNLKSRTDLFQEETLNLSAERANIQKQGVLLDNKIQELAFQLSELGKVSDVYKGPAGSAIVHIRESIKALGILPSAVAGGAAAQMLRNRGSISRSSSARSLD